MICEKCKKQHATVHLTEIVNDEKREAHLCDECARSAGVGFKFTFSLSDVLGSLTEAKPGKGAKGRADFKCPQCGMRFSEFRSKARLGCSHDYDIFKSALVPLLEKIHGGTQHVGKVPHTVDTQVRKENEVVRLKRRLDTLVKSEQFEKAAEVRDRIKILEEDLGKE